MIEAGAAIAAPVDAAPGAPRRPSAPVDVDPGAPARPAPLPQIELGVGETAERDVGFAIGCQCDDPALVRAEMRAKSPHSNAFVVTGLRAGVTRCRVGTEPNRPSLVYEVLVLPRRPP